MTSRKTLLALGCAWLVWIWALALASNAVWPWFSGPHGWSYDVVRRATPLARWDSGWYIGIADRGYGEPPRRVGEQTNHAFFPLYPFLTRLVTRGLGIETSLAGNLVSASCLLGTLVLFGGWVGRRFGPDRVLPAALALLLFPTSFFFSTVYTESLLLFLSLLSIVLLEKGRFATGLIAGYLAGLTRISGVVLAPYAFLVAWNEARARGLSPSDSIGRAAVAGAAPVAGFATFCAYLWHRFSDPLLFVRAQHNWSTEEKTILDGPLLIWRTVVGDVTTGKVLHASPARTLEGIYILLFLVLAVVLVWRKRYPESLFVAATAIIVLFTGTLESAGRYVLPAFPAFAALAGLSSRRHLWIALLAASAALQAVYVFVFVHWIWAG